ncbi:MAG: hypothetical protein EOM67_13900 [Spirochaetia bacterium]|nr:hypothetical protein [Spirochaetia bacterium]
MSIKGLIRVLEEGNGRGYMNDYSMSVNAYDAYLSGEMPLSKWNKKGILKNAESILSGDKDITLEEKQYRMGVLSKLSLSELKELLKNSSWHHTSSRYNKTDFYTVDDEVILGSREEFEDFIYDIDPDVETKEKSPAYYAEVKYVVWGGTRRHPVGRDVQDVAEIVDDWAFCGKNRVKKKVTGNYFEIVRTIDKRDYMKTIRTGEMPAGYLGKSRVSKMNNSTLLGQIKNMKKSEIAKLFLDNKKHTDAWKTKVFFDEQNYDADTSCTVQVTPTAYITFNFRARTSKRRLFFETMKSEEKNLSLSFDDIVKNATELSVKFVVSNVPDFDNNLNSILSSVTFHNIDNIDFFARLVKVPVGYKTAVLGRGYDEDIKEYIQFVKETGLAVEE